MEGGNKLPDLPPSHAKFWDRAVKHRIELMKKPEHEHYFGINGREITCKCGVGFPFTGREKVAKGEIVVAASDAVVT